MPSIFEVCDAMLGIYRERQGNPDFWSEPLNALSNAAFLIAAFFAWDFASRRQATTHTTIALVSLVGLIGFGSFFFHTVPNHFTMWFDVAPIALFQMLFLWLAGHRILRLSRLASAALVIGVVGLSFALFPVHKPFNGSLFYFPSLLAMLVIGLVWSRKSRCEPYLLVIAACCFTLAIIARSVDMIVPWQFGSHFVWHLSNGLVVYLALRAWIVNDAENQKIELLGP
jgi:hypothetical protein